MGYDRHDVHRYKGPAVRGDIRCPNHPASMREPATKPTTNCYPDRPCTCGTTVTVPDDVMPRIRQWPLWGTRDWQRLYGRRNAVETLNSKVRANGLRRGYTHVFTQPRNDLLLCFLFVAVNIHEARIWRILNQQPTVDGPKEETDSEHTLAVQHVAARNAAGPPGPPPPPG